MRVIVRHVMVASGLTFLLACGLADRPAEDTPSSAGFVPTVQRIENFELRDTKGQLRSLEEFDDQRLVVVAFLGTECPLAKLYGPRLSELAEKYASGRVQFLGINSNHQDSMEELVEYAQSHQLSFPMLKDPASVIADHFGASRTPEVFLLDESRTVRYQGRIDDQYAIGIKRDEPRRMDLATAIDQVLDGVSVETPMTEPIGCLIGRAPHNESREEVTYSGQIAPILRRRCVSCHQPNQAAPFSLTKYEEVAGWSSMIREVVDDRRMPPWFADPQHGEFENDARLDDSEREMLLRWIDDGCSPGKSTQSKSLISVSSAWQIPEPELILQVQDEPTLIPADGEVAYQYFVIDPGFREDKFIKAVQVKPGNAQVVHHALISLADPDDPSMGIGNCGILINYAPGMQPTVLPEGVAIHVPAGQKFVAQMHYTPIGTEQFDQTCIGFVFADPEEVTQHVSGSAIVNTGIQIPAGASSHRETANLTLQNDVSLLSVSPHMHLRGKSFRYEAEYPNGEKEILLDIPRYDFNWQLRYIFKEPKVLPRGTTLTCTATYDNSRANPANPAPDTTVFWGDQTNDEMLIGFISFIIQ